MQALTLPVSHFFSSARVRMGSFVSESEKLAHASAVISALGLDKVRHSIVGDEMSRGLSGGERKRLNIGIELAAAPKKASASARGHLFVTSLTSHRGLKLGLAPSCL